jgi:Protein of unknown function (DUF732)
LGERGGQTHARYHEDICCDGFGSWDGDCCRRTGGGTAREGYLFDMRSDGFTGPDSEMLDWGYRACDDWRDGINRDVIIDNIYENTDESISREDATFLFDSATFYLC